ncbi:ankyrin repeat domain-containing protein [Burkholderia contaminans]|uniref:ankyrin repeat domain-containing protein n=1 Tax=Burkholderia contaminans TaxID=488447 RepID=UPI001CF41831|nr:ankyrin repeat domain-containing protein [Burkholderia contaminans]MCA7913348.1 ankyrin repeat domain-containing protein [Burkholderia contaminans]UUX39820.1 ankyrin repeat domain-containing protein [Burkholderia contaminans]
MQSKRLTHAIRATATVLALAAITGCAHLPDQPAYSPADAAALRRYDGDWFDAARVGRVDILRALHEAGYPVDATDSHGYTAVILASYDGQPAALDYLLSAGANACTGDRHGNTALMGALFRNEPDIARRLIDTPCPIDETNGAGETALGFATLFNRFDLIPLLVARGANPNHVDRRGQSLLELARSHDNTEAVDALRHAGARQ